MGKCYFFQNQYFCIRILRLQKTLIFWSTNPLKIFKNCVGKCLWKHMLILHRILKVLASMLGRQEGSFLLVPSHVFVIFSNTRPRHAPSGPKTLQETPKTHWRPPKSAQVPPKTHPKHPQRRPQEPKTFPRRPQEVLRTAFLVVLDNSNLVESVFINFLHTLPVRTPKNIDLPYRSIKLCLACCSVSFICIIRMHSCRDWGQG